MFLNLFLFYQVVRPLGRKSVNKYLYLYCNYWYVCVRQYMLFVFCQALCGTKHHVARQFRSLHAVFFRSKFCVLLKRLIVKMFRIVYALPSSCDEVIARVYLINATKQLFTLRPNQPTLMLNPFIGCYHLHPPLSFITVTWPTRKLSDRLVSL